MRTHEPKGPCYSFSLTTPRAKRPQAYEQLDGDVRFSVRSPENFLVKSGGWGVVYTGVRLDIPRRSPAKLTFHAPEWMPRGINVTAQLDDGNIIVYIANLTDDPFVVSRGAWVLVGYIKRRELTSWERFLAWLDRWFML